MNPGGRNKRELLVILHSVFGPGFVETEHRFHPTRRWRFDYAVPRLNLAVEYQGHGSTGRTKHVGGHASIGGLTNDCEKLNAAQALGWTVLKFTAFHFRERDRTKHDLISPLETVRLFTNDQIHP